MFSLLNFDESFFVLDSMLTSVNSNLGSNNKEGEKWILKMLALINANIIMSSTTTIR